jgi:glutathione S-transferase
MPNRPITKLTLYGDSISGNCLKTKWTAEYLGIEHDWVEISVVEGGTRSDAFMTMNPSGQVPVMRLPDGRILPQSNAIILYLAEIGGGSELIPADPFEKAKMMSWLFWEQYSHEPYIAVMYRYDEFDHNFVKARVAAVQRDQVERRLAGEITEDQFRRCG